MHENSHVYLILVEEMPWSEVQELTGCTEHAIRRAIAEAMDKIGHQP